MTKALLHPLGQSLSYGRLSLLAKVLWPMLLSMSDDQGRGTAEADAVRWYVCPNVPEITIDAIPGLLQEMQEQSMIVVYECDRGTMAYQVVRWWEYQSLRWARESKWSPPDGWQDRIRYSNRGDIHQESWDKPGGFVSVPVIDNCTENNIEVYPDNQPNLTQLNLTKEDLGAGAPISFDDWLRALQKPKSVGESNGIAVLVRMGQSLYERFPADSAVYGRVGKLAKKAGSQSKLASIFWQHASKPLAIPLDYLTTVVYGKPGNGAPKGRLGEPVQRDPEQQRQHDELTALIKRQTGGDP